jgi:hypothetical protein
VYAAATFTSVADRTEAIITWAAHWIDNPKPFVWKSSQPLRPRDDVVMPLVVASGRCRPVQDFPKCRSESSPAGRGQLAAQRWSSDAQGRAAREVGLIRVTAFVTTSRE